MVAGVLYGLLLFSVFCCFLLFFLLFRLFAVG